MAVTSRLSRPLQRRCTHCRRIQEVRLTALYHVVVPNKGGGTRRDGGYDCRFCGTPNVIPSGEMPLGLVLQLPSRADLQAADTKAPETQAPDTKIAEPPEATAVDAAPAPKAPARPPTTKRTPPPAWIVGTKARTMLTTAFDRVRQSASAHCTAFVRDPAGALSLVDARALIDDGDILDWLDRSACELLVLGGSGGGMRWKAIFHPIAGAATLAVEPERD